MYHLISCTTSHCLQEANCTELLAHSIIAHPRGTISRGVAAFFRDAQRANAVVVLDGAEILLANVASEPTIHVHVEVTVYRPLCIVHCVYRVYCVVSTVL